MTNLPLSASEGLEKVLEHYNKMVFRLAYSRTGNYHDANDVMQDVFLRYIKADKTYNDEEHRKAWFIRATVNCSKSFVTTAWNRHRSAGEIQDDLEGSVDSSLEKYDTKNAVIEAVLALPEKYRTVVHLFYYEDLPVAKISEYTGISLSNVKTRLTRAREMLKETLKGVEFDD